MLGELSRERLDGRGDILPQNESTPGIAVLYRCRAG
jgi:hypothetical protein